MSDQKTEPTICARQWHLNVFCNPVLMPTCMHEHCCVPYITGPRLSVQKVQQQPAVYELHLHESNSAFCQYCDALDVAGIHQVKELGIGQGQASYWWQHFTIVDFVRERLKCLLYVFQGLQVNGCKRCCQHCSLLYEYQQSVEAQCG